MKAVLFSFISMIIFASTSFAETHANYTGKFNGRAGQISITESAGTYYFAFAGNDGSTDLLGKKCSTQVGASNKVKVKDGVVRRIIFPLSTRCNVAGDELVADIKEGTVRLSVFEGESNMPICHVDQWGREYCRDQYWPSYLTGKFKSN